jgi:hypothetical protein
MGMFTLSGLPYLRKAKTLHKNIVEEFLLKAKNSSVKGPLTFKFPKTALLTIRLY